MPSLYFNSEVGACTTEKQAKECITRTMMAYITLKKHVSAVYQKQGAFSNIQLCSEQGKSQFISEFHNNLDKATQERVTIFIKDLSKGNIAYPPITHTKTLKNLDYPSAFLEYVLEQEGMTLSFPSDTYWKTDFIEFNECTDSIPNIWGQTDFQPINAWLTQWHQKTSTIFNRIKNDFGIDFCCTNISEASFTLHEWKMVYTTFKKASHLYFAISPPLIKKWNNLPIYYIRDKNHSNFTLRAFFTKLGAKIYIGEIYHKNETNTLKEESAAERSYKKFRDLGLL